MIKSINLLDLMIFFCIVELMRVLFFLSLLLSTTVYSSSKITYFESFAVENEEQTINHIYCDPNNENKFFYILDNKVYSYLNEETKIILDLSKKDIKESDDESSIKEKLKELYNNIYEEEKEAIEDEYGVDDAEEYYDDLIKERTELRMEDESVMLKDENSNEKIKTSDIRSLINGFVFLKNSSSNIFIETDENIYLSDNNGNSFNSQNLSEIPKINLKDVNINLNENNLLFTSNNKLYYYEKNSVSQVYLSIYKDEEVEKVDSFYPFITILTENSIFLVKQDESKLVLVNKFKRKVDSIDKISYFGGKYLFYVSENIITVTNTLTSNSVDISFSDYEISDLYYRDNGLYLATDRGFLFFDFKTRELNDLSLGLIPETANTISLSNKNHIYVSNKSGIYLLKEFKTLKELGKEKNLFQIMKKIELSYPPLEKILAAANSYNFLKNDTAITRNRLSMFMPKLQLVGRWTLKNTQNLDNRLLNNYNFNDTLYFQAFLYFDLSKLIFNTKELTLDKINGKRTILRNKLTEELTLYYNNRKLMELRFYMSQTNKLEFKIKMLEYGAIINSLTGKKYF